MEQIYAYTEKESNIRWLLSLDGQNVEVFCDGESRTYTIPNVDTVIDMKTEDNYVFIYIKGGNYFQFKFEINKLLVGDIFNKNDEFLDTFALHTFGEI